MLSKDTESTTHEMLECARCDDARSKADEKEQAHSPPHPGPAALPTPTQSVAPVKPRPWYSQCRIRLCANDTRIGWRTIATRRGLGCPECSALSVACRAWNALSYRHSSHHCSARVLSRLSRLSSGSSAPRSLGLLHSAAAPMSEVFPKARPILAALPHRVPVCSVRSLLGLPCTAAQLRRSAAVSPIRSAGPRRFDRWQAVQARAVAKARGEFVPPTSTAKLVCGNRSSA